MDYYIILIVRIYKKNIMESYLDFHYSHCDFSSKNDLPTIPFGIKNFDKIIHFGFYFILIMLYLFESRTNLKPSTWVLGFLICLAVGISTEFGQQVLQMGRSFEWSDMLANILEIFRDWFCLKSC
jgi:VanZ family protein